MFGKLQLLNKYKTIQASLENESFGVDLLNTPTLDSWTFRYSTTSTLIIKIYISNMKHIDHFVHVVKNTIIAL